MTVKAPKNVQECYRMATQSILRIFKHKIAVYNNGTKDYKERFGLEATCPVLFTKRNRK